jgi:hypothetical protein
MGQQLALSRQVSIAVAFAGLSLASPPATAAATRGDIHAVFWSAEAGERPLADAFFRCLTRGTSFSSGWSGEFGLPSVAYAGSVVLPGTTPPRLSLGGLAQLLIQAFDEGRLPAPVSGVANEYISFTPSTTIVGNLCTGPTAGCGEHSWHNTYKGVSFDVASVPVGPCNCHNMWDSESKKTTEVAEHEAGEGLARLAGAAFEVGDRCEALKENLTCCGSSYQVQQLAGARGATSCEPISSNGNQAACAVDDARDAGADDSGGITPGSDAARGAPGSGSSDAAPSPPGPDSGPADAGRGGLPTGNASADAAAGAAPSMVGSGGGTGGGGTGSTGLVDAGLGASSGPSAAPGGMRAGCTCGTIGGAGADERGSGWGTAALAGALALVILVQRRRAAAGNPARGDQG